MSNSPSKTSRTAKSREAPPKTHRRLRAARKGRRPARRKAVGAGDQSARRLLSQRNAELAIISSVQQGLAAQRSFDAIVDLVGDKLREIFRNRDMEIRIYDPRTNLIHYPYHYENGKRVAVPSNPLAERGVSAHILRTRETLVFNEGMAEAYEKYGAWLLPGTKMEKSSVYVPLVAAGQARGLICLMDLRREHAFSDDDVRLLQTLAGSMGVALENARLFDETQRLLKETEQRNAELAIINSVQAALAAKLDIQGIYDAVGDKIREIFQNRDVEIRIYDPRTNLVHFPYHYEGGKRIAISSGPLPARGFFAHILQTREAIVVSENMAQAYEKYGAVLLPGTQQEKSSVYVPLVAAGQARGLIGLVDVEREHAFSDSDVRLLQTLANSMSVALENARLFDETQHLLKETEQRAAELAVINSIQEGIAAKLDFQAIVDLVGDKLREVFATGDIGINWHDKSSDRIHYLYQYEHGLRLHPPSVPSSKSPSWSILSQRRRPIVGRTTAELDAIGFGNFPGTDPCLSAVYVPILGKDGLLGVIYLGSFERENAFGDAAVRLLGTVAASMGVALENAQLFDETQRRTRETAALVEVGRDISSTLDIAAVMDRIARHAKDLLHADNSAIFLPEVDGQTYRAIVAIGDVAEQIKAMEVHEGVGIVGGILQAGNAEFVNDTEADRRTIQIPGTPRRSDERLMVAPLMAGAAVKGAMAVWRRGGRGFEAAELEFLKGLSLQAAVAIENARLFNETKEALEHLQASAEVLGVISSSVGDTKAVFDKILESSERLFEGNFIGMTLIEGDIVRLGGYRGPASQAFMKMFPFRLDRDSGTGKSILEHRLIHFANVQTDDGVPERMRVAGSLTNTKSQVLAPLVWKDRAMGAIFVGRPVVRPFSEKEITLVRTFADQAVIAIENARLFKELETRTAQLTRSVGELKALGEVGQAVSSTLDLETVLSTIVSRATQLAGVDSGSIYEYDEANDEFKLRAADRLPDDLIEALRANPIRKGEGLVGRMALTREPIQIRDIAETGAYQSRVREMLIRLGYRSLLAVPLLRENHLLGGLAVNRKSAGDFEPGVIELLKTFATQSALAIQNARLFREIEAKSRELERASRHKSEFLANMSHELRTPLNAIIGFSEVLSERMFGEINDKQAEYVADILESGRHLLSLINDILDLSKIEAGRMELERRKFDLPSAIENTFVLMRERAQRRGITLSCDVGEGLRTIHADERKVKQVLLNLLSNALKFTPEGGRIDVRADVRDGVAEIAVADTGVGIAPEDQQAVFEEFRQVGTAAKKSEGTGLGLAISRKFIELHGGKIWVSSLIGKGSTFTFTLPLEAVE